jgi:hypothetical protein
VTKLVITSQPTASGVANTTVEFKIAAQDALGTTKTNLNDDPLGHRAKVDVDLLKADGTVHTADVLQNVLISSGMATVTVPAANLQTVGTYSFAVRWTGATSIANSIGSAVAKASTTSYAVTPGTLHKVAWKSTTSAFLAADGVSTSTITYQLQDQWNNLVPSATNTVTFERFGSTNFTTLPSTLAVTPVNGAASITVTANVTPGIDQFQVVVKDANGNEIVGSKNSTASQTSI